MPVVSEEKLMITVFLEVKIEMIQATAKKVLSRIAGQIREEGPLADQL